MAHSSYRGSFMFADTQQKTIKIKHNKLSLAIKTGACLMLGLLSLSSVADENSTKRPNFLWLLSEDNSKHYLKLYDKHGANMPNVEGLAKEGLVFNNAFSNAPVCSTARTTLALGAYGSRLNTNYHRAYHKISLPNQLKPIGALLKDAGYYTSNNAKDDYNFLEPEATWNLVNGKATWDGRKPGQPFFHMQTWGTTHEGKLHFPLEDVSAKPTKHDPNKVAVAPIYPDTELFRYTYARTLDNHLTVDKQIGAVLDKLKKENLLEDTFVFYFGDHGGVLPNSKGYLTERGLSVPLVVRIPENYRHLVSADIANLKNFRVNGFVSFVDFAPTLLKLAGLPAHPEHDGNAFLGKGISLGDLNKRNTTIGYADRFDEKYDLVRSLRKGKFKYVRHFQPFNPDGLHNGYRYRQHAFSQWREFYQQGKLNPVQAAFFERKPAEALYDIENDPFETKNLATSASYQRKLAELRRELINNLKGQPDLGFFPESFKDLRENNSQQAFVKKHRAYIAKLIDIANLQLLPYQEAKPQIKQALASNNTWQRYWALITLSHFGYQAQEFAPQVKKLMNKDNELLNQARAAEFLTLIDQFEPKQFIEQLIAQAKDDIKVLELMNIATLLHDTKNKTFDIEFKQAWHAFPKDKKKVKTPEGKKASNLLYWLNNRIDYLKS